MVVGCAEQQRRYAANPRGDPELGVGHANESNKKGRGGTCSRCRPVGGGSALLGITPLSLPRLSSESWASASPNLRTFLDLRCLFARYGLAYRPRSKNRFRYSFSCLVSEPTAI